MHAAPSEFATLKQLEPFMVQLESFMKTVFASSDCATPGFYYLHAKPIESVTFMQLVIAMTVAATEFAKVC